MTKATHNGTCQACGRSQAFYRGTVAKHGYQVKGWGFFHGVCRGAENKPLEQEKTITEATIKFLRETYAPQADQYALDLESGKKEPKFYVDKWIQDDPNNKWRGHYEKTQVARADLSEGVVRSQIKAAILNAQSDAKHARAHADGLVRLIADRHGKPLMPISESRLVVGAKVRLFGKKDGVTGTVIKIEDKVASGCGPYMNGKLLLHAFVKDDESDHVYSIPTRSIRQSAIL